MIHITEWKPPKKERYIYKETKEGIDSIGINIDKCFPNSKNALKKNPELYTFLNNRRLFDKTLQMVTNYIDYFIEFYDEDKELIPIYIKLKSELELSKLSDTNIFIKRICAEFFKNSRLKKNIKKMVDDNYHLDVTVIGMREFTGTRDFTNDEAKILLSASMMMKLTIPLVAHSVSTNKENNLEERHQFISECFTEVFHKMCSDEQLIDIMTKLYWYVSGKVDTHSGNNELMWDNQGAIGGWTESGFIDDLMNSHILYLNLFKLNFEENLMAFIKVIVENQLTHNISRVKYKKDILLDMDINYSRTDGPRELARIDKWEQFMTKLDESQIILCEVSLNTIITNYIETFGIITEEEINFYQENLNYNSRFHSDLIFSIFAKDFGGYMELHNCSLIEYTQFIIIMKRRMIDQMFVGLPFILTSNVLGKRQSSQLRNTVFMNSIKQSSTYKNLMEKSYSALEGFNNNDELIMDFIKFILTHNFGYVEYDEPELLNKKIKLDYKIVIDELLMFIDSI